MRTITQRLAAAAVAATLMTGAAALDATGSASAASAYCSSWSAGSYFYLHCRYDDGMHRLFVSGNGSIRSYAWYD